MYPRLSIRHTFFDDIHRNYATSIDSHGMILCNIRTHRNPITLRRPPLVQTPTALALGLVGWFSTVFANAGFAMQDSPSDFATWLASQPTDTPAQLVLSDYHVSWSVQLHEVPPPEVLAHLREQVGAAADHPEKETLAAFERRLKGDPDIERLEFWDGGAGAFRYNRSFRDESGAHYFDIVSTHRDYWVMSDRQLTLLKPHREVPNRDYRSSEPEIRMQLSLMLSGGFALVPGMDLMKQSVQVTNGSWQCMMRIRATGAALLYEGIWDAGLTTYVVHRVSIAESPGGPADVGKCWVMTDWRGVADMSHPVAGRVEERLPDGRLRRVLVLESVERVDPDEFVTVTRTPSPTTQSDPVRGAVTFTSVWDYLNTNAFLVEDPETGDLVSTLRIPDSDAPAKTMRILGWLAVGVIVACLGWIRVQRWKSSRPIP